MTDWFRRDILLRATRVSLLVGTILALINHGDTVINGDISWSLVLKMILTYVVPFAVSLYSGVRAVGRREERMVDRE